MGLSLYYVESTAPFKTEILNRLVSRHLQFNLKDSFRILTPDFSAASDLEEALTEDPKAGKILIGKSLLTPEKFAREILQHHPRLRPLAGKSALGKALRLALRSMGRCQRIDYSTELKYQWGLARLDHLSKIFRYSKPLSHGAMKLLQERRRIVQTQWGLWEPEGALEEARKILAQGRAVGLDEVEEIFFLGFPGLEGGLLEWILAFLKGLPHADLHIFLPPPEIGIDPQGLLAPLYEILEGRADSLNRYQPLNLPEMIPCSYPTPLHEAAHLVDPLRTADALGFHGEGMSSTYLRDGLRISPPPLPHPGLVPEALLRDSEAEARGEEEVYFRQLYSELEPRFQEKRLTLAQGGHLAPLYHLERAFELLRNKMQWEFYQEELMPRADWIQSLREEFQEIRWTPLGPSSNPRALRSYATPGLKTASQIYLFELNEGIFPRSPDFALLQMGEADPLEGHEAYLSAKAILHLGVHRAYLSYVDQDMEGRSQKPSALLERLTGQAVLPGSSAVPASLFSTGHHPFFNDLTGAGRKPPAGDLSHLPVQKLIAAKAARRPLSASYLDDFAKCPWKFFARWHLSLEEAVDRPLEMEPMLRGKLSHDYLERVYRALIPSFFQKGILPGPADLKQTLADALEQGQTHWREWPEVKRMPPRLFQEEINLLKARVGQFVENEIAAWNRAGRPLFPRELEWRFGAAPLPRVDFPLRDGQKVSLAGAVDRIDYNEKSGEYLLLDYKSSSSEDLARELRAGLSFQLIIYLHAVQQALFPKGQPLGALYGDLKRSQKNQGLALKEPLKPFGWVKGNNKSFMKSEDFSENRRLLEESLKEALNKILQGSYPLTPPACQGARCPYHEICRYDHQPL